MSQVEYHREGVEALKVLNNAITTSRLYPPEAPQVANAVERGYAGIRAFLDKYTELDFSVHSDSWFLCGEALSEEILNTFPNLVVYRQLRLLEVQRLSLNQNIDRFTFGQLLTVLNATQDKITSVGGGLQFITSLGLVSFFPTTEDSRKAGSEGGPDTDGGKPRKQVTVRPALVACLLGKDDRPLIVDELQQKMAKPELCVQIMSAGVGKILQGIRQKKRIIATPFFTDLITNAESLISEEDREAVAKKFAEFLDESLKDNALCVLLSQDFPQGFGDRIHHHLIEALSLERFGTIVVLFREHIAANRTKDENADQLNVLGQAMNKLISSEKGNRFLSTEKAKNIIHDGEKERKKRRIEAGIKGLVEGRLEVLESEELLQHIPRSIRLLLKDDNKEYIPQILTNMKTYLAQLGVSQRTKILDSLVEIGERLLESREYDLLDSLVETFIGEAKRGSSDVEVFEKNITLLHAVMQNYWEREWFKEGDRILNVLYQMRSREIDKPESLRAIVAKVQDSNIDRASLPIMLEQCLTSPDDDVLRYRMILQGPVAVRFLIEALISAEKSNDRMRLIDMLTSIGAFVPNVVRERLPGHMPWYGKRNLLKLLGETGREDDAEAALPYLQHNDLRVQREAFLCIYLIGGRLRKSLFLSVLDESPALIQTQIVEAFAGFCDREIALKLGEMIADYTSFSSDNREKLLLAMIETLGKCPCSEAYKALEQFLSMRRQRGSRNVPDSIWSAAERASGDLEQELKEARKKHLQASQLRKIALKQAAQLMKSGTGQRIITGLPQEQLIRNYLAKGNTKEAVNELLDLIEKTAKSRNFAQADQLKEWLVDIDGSAFTKIIKAIELIDREKGAGVANGHLDVWIALYDALATDEFEELFGSLIHSSYQPGEQIVAKGALKRNLFLINSGKVKLYFEEDTGEVLIKIMERGEIFGADVFFEESIWTMSVASIGFTEVSILRSDRLPEWAVKFPQLERKLRNFCSKFEDSAKILENFAKDRRAFERIRLSGRIRTILLDNRERRIGSVTENDLLDLSVGGVSYRCVARNNENLRQLLGHRVQVEFPIGKGEDDPHIVIGDIIAIKAHPEENEYSIHVKFYSVLELALVNQIVQALQTAAG